MGIEIEIEELRRRKAGKERGEMIVVRVSSEEMKRRIMENKEKLRREKIWIEEDLTFQERRMKWKLKGVAVKEERKGNRVRQVYGRMWINDRW